jgi:hypothetical protein
MPQCGSMMKSDAVMGTACPSDASPYSSSATISEHNKLIHVYRIRIAQTLVQPHYRLCCVVCIC